MTTKNHNNERIAKRIARAGLCSRREAEKWIEAGRVIVNGEIIKSPALNVSPECKILVDNKPLPKTQNTRLFLYHKPAGLLCTNKDPQGRKTIFEALPPTLPRVMSVGRLDYNSEGLLLLTNDGELSRFLELPSTGWKRRYKVRVFGKVNQDRLSTIKKGMTIEGITYKFVEAKIEREQGNNTWLNVALKEGKNREIRRVMESLDLKVNRLIRTDYGPFSLGKLKKNTVQEIESAILKEQIKKYFGRSS